MSFSPKPILPLLLILFSLFNLQAQNAWINEFHYDNASSDEGEFVEVVIQDAASYDLSLFTLLLYNGSDGETYGSSHSLDSFSEGITENGFTIFYKDISGIQNGDDAFSLDYDGTLIQFISYEGAFTGVGGPVDGVLSTEIGVEETTSTPIGESLQLTGSGIAYSDFSWLAPDLETKGRLNNGQFFGAACTAPTTQASFSIPSSAEIGDNQINLNWTRGDGDGVLILLKENSAVNESPENGTTYTADADFSSGLADEIGTGNFVVYDGSATSVNITGLNRGTQYHFSILEYLATDSCYLTESETVSVTTSTSFDEDSEITAPENQVPSSDISSIANSESDSVQVLKFKLSDQGSSDGAPTLLNSIMIEKSAENNVEDWATAIAGAKLSDGTSDLTVNSVSITQDNIEFDLTGNEFSIANGSTETLSLFIWLKELQNDGDTVGFEIPKNHGFGADVNGSLFINSISSAIISNPFKIEVEATEFQINSVSSAQVSDAFNFSARAVDSNGNTDIAAREINLTVETGSGSLVSPSAGLGSIAMQDGFFEWTDLEYDTEESIIIEASDGDGLSTNSPEISIIPLINTVFISEYVEGSSSNKALEIFNNSGELINLSDFSLAIYTNGDETPSFEYQLSNIQPDLADQENLVVANTSADSVLKAAADTTQFSITNFNGDDALALLYKGNIIDLIGEIGNDPGSAWDVAGIAEATQDKTLVRKASVIEGNANTLASFGGSQMDSEWIVYDTDEFSYLGSHFRCTAPTEQVSNISVQNITENTVDVNWNRPTGLHSIVLIKEENEIDFPPISGNSYTANSDFSLAEELGNGNKIVFASNEENASISNLTSGTTYHIAMYAYDALENCYNLDLPATASFTTEIALDDDSEINELSQPTVSTLLSTVDEEAEAEDVFQFQIADLATHDTVSTFIDRMVFESAGANSLLWDKTLNAVLKDGNGKINNADITIVNDSINIVFPENKEYEIPSGESVDFKLAVWFNRFEVSDTQQFALQIPSEHEFVSLDSGSTLFSTLGDSISSEKIEIIEAFDKIEEIRNGTNGNIYLTTGNVSSNDFGNENTQFYIQKEESTTYEQGIAVYSDVEVPNITPGNKVKIWGTREEENGSIRINSDSIMILDTDEFIPQTYSISASDFTISNALIGTRVQLDSLVLDQPELWGDFVQNVFSFSKGDDTVFVKVEPNNSYSNGNAQVPFGAVDLQGIMETKNDSVQLIISLDGEISDSYSPIFEIDPQISYIQSEQVELSFSVNELSTVYYALKSMGDSIPDLEVLKNPQSDAQIINSGHEKIEIENVGNINFVDIQNLSSNTQYSLFIVAEDTLGNTNEIRQLDFFTLNAEADEDVTVVDANEQISAIHINAFETTNNFASVFNFTITDGGTSDSLSTFVNQMVIHSPPENAVAFDELLNEAELYDLSNDTLINTHSLIFSDSIVFQLDEIFELNDGDSNSFQLRIKLKDSVEDAQNISFEIPSNENAWQVELYGSQLGEYFGESVVSSVHSIDVVATELHISNPAEVYAGEDFNIAIVARDVNGNIDKSEKTLTISVGTAGELSGQTQLDLTNGEGEFENLSFDQPGLFTFEITGNSLAEAIEINFIHPEITLDTTGLNSDFGLVTFPDRSEIQSYKFSSEHLKDSLLVAAPRGFQLSLNPSFANETDTLIFADDSYSLSQIYVRFLPTENNGDFYQGSILHISQDADTVLLPVSGQEGTLSLSSIASVRDKSIGERVKVQGVVIGGENQFEDKIVIQDDSAGIVIQELNSANFNFGDSVEVEGVLYQEDDWLSLIPEKELNILSSDSIVVDPLLKLISEVHNSLESQRVRIENLDISVEGQFTKGEYFIIDENFDSLILKINRESHPLVGTEIPIGKVNLTGFIGWENDNFRLYPELEQDLDIIPRDTILTINAPENGLNFGQVLLDEFSESQSYTLKAENLPENLRISANENFQISLLRNSNYSNNLELPINERGDIPEIEVHVRFSPKTAKGGDVNGEIVHISGEQERILPLNGVEEMITSNHSSFENQILIYPNPVNSELQIELLDNGDFQFQLIGIDGVALIKGELNNGNNNKTIDFNEIEKGIYLLSISNGVESYQYRIIKK